MERFNALLFLGITFLINLRFGPAHTLYLTYSLLVLVFILFQGTWYWQLKLTSLRGSRQLNHQAAALTFKRFQKLNVLLFFFSPGVILLQWSAAGYTLENTLVEWALLVNAFGILEYVNYYETQLMYDNRYDIKYLLVNKRLKKASLKKDLLQTRF